MEKFSKPNSTFNNETLSVEDVMNLVADSQQQLKEDIKFMNKDKFGLQLTQEDRQEILGVVTLKALEAAATYNPKLSKMRTWLKTIAHNEIVSFLNQRSLYVRKSVQYMDENDDNGRFDDGIRQMHYRLDDEECRKIGVFGKETARKSLLMAECMKCAIDSLCQRDRDVIFMIKEGLSGKQIADALGIKETAQRKLVFDMRGRLRKRLVEMRYVDIDEHSSKYCNTTVRLEDVIEQEFLLMQASRSSKNG
jgi:RNA polymerase sigma factor (sigma-70 family)